MANRNTDMDTKISISGEKEYKEACKDINKKRGTGAIVCLYDNKLYLDDNLVVLPIEYI